MSAHTAPSRFARSGSTVRFDNDGPPVTVTVCTSRIVRVELSDGRDVPGPSYVGPRSWAGAPFEVLDGARVRLSTADLRVEAATSPLRLTFLDASGEWLLREPARGGMLTESVGDAGRRLHASFEFSGEQHFYGLGQGGQSSTGSASPPALEHAHRTRPGVGHRRPVARVQPRLRALLRQYERRDAVGGPLRRRGADRLHRGSRAAGLVLRPRSRPAWTSCARWPSCSAGRRCRPAGRSDSCSRPAISTIPRRCAGSRERFATSESPATASSFSRPTARPRAGTAGWGISAFSRPSGPIRPRCIDEARQQHFEIITHEYPVIHEQSPLFAEAEATRIPPRRRLRPGGRDSAPERQLSARASDSSTFPTRRPAPGGGGTLRLRRARRRRLVARRRRRTAGAGACSIDGDGTRSTISTTSSASEAFADGEARDRPDQRVLSALPLGPAGHAAVRRDVWSGDINNDLRHASRRRSPSGSTPDCRACRTGAPISAASSFGSAETGELFARWFQFGAFSPIFRSHGWRWREHLPWSYGEEVEAICREILGASLPAVAVHLHAGLAGAHARPAAHAPARPQLSRRPARLGARHTSSSGATTSWSRPSRAKAPGPGRSICPQAAGTISGAARATTDRAASRSTRRSTGCRCFVRAGAIVPIGPVVQHTGERPLDEITLLIYPDGASSFELYEDDGRSNAYRRGQHALTRFECAATSTGITVRIGEPVGARSIVPASRRYLVRLRIDGASSRHRGGPRTTAATGRSGPRRRGLVAGRPRIRDDSPARSACPHHHRDVSRRRLFQPPVRCPESEIIGSRRRAGPGVPPRGTVASADCRSDSQSSVAPLSAATGRDSACPAGRDPWPRPAHCRHIPRLRTLATT